MGLVWEEPTGCRKSQRCDLGAPGASGSWKGAGAGGQGDGPVGLGGAAVQEEIGEVSVGCSRLEAGRQESVQSGRRRLQGRQRIIHLEARAVRPGKSARIPGLGSHGELIEAKLFHPPVKMCSASNPS